jgi:hypothetical protein
MSAATEKISSNLLRLQERAGDFVYHGSGLKND